MNAATFCLKVLGSDSRSIGEPLTLGRLQGNAGAAHVINFKFGTGVLAEIKFGQIAVKVLLATMLVIVSVAPPVLVRVTVWAALVLPTLTLLKVKLVGEREAAGPLVPTPVRLTI